ncbi:MAG TPA: hypothetical protein VK547_09775, partial [Candidatus Udaeobacter sp.]|nr:hypothetical protein [Candidatus Udaeobacter sp.]
MGNRNMQYVAVTKERKKTGCLGVAGHGCLTVFTGGIWLLIGPPMHWLWHLIGPRKKSVTRAYGPGVQQPAAPPPQPYPGPPQQPYAQQPLPGGPWQQPP